MKTIAMTLAMSLLAVPAFAQSGSSSSGSSASGTSGGTAASTSGQASRPSAVTQQKLRDQLTKAGFSQVQILDASYLVQARTQDGNQVLMVIDPPMRGATGAGGTGSSGSGSSTTGSGSNP